jgi:hypothetical protein
MHCQLSIEAKLCSKPMQARQKPNQIPVGVRTFSFAADFRCVLLCPYFCPSSLADPDSPPRLPVPETGRPKQAHHNAKFNADNFIRVTPEFYKYFPVAEVNVVSGHFSVGSEKLPVILSASFVSGR